MLRNSQIQFLQRLVGMLLRKWALRILETTKTTLVCYLYTYEIYQRFVNILTRQTNHAYNAKYHNEDMPQIKLYFECSFKSNTTGYYGIHPILIKIILQSILPFITYIFNTIISKPKFYQYQNRLLNTGQLLFNLICQRHFQNSYVYRWVDLCSD